MFIEQTVALQAVVKLADHAVEAVALGGCVPVSVVVAAPVVVGFGAGGAVMAAKARMYPAWSRTIVLDPSADDAGLFPGAPVNGRGAGVCLHGAGKRLRSSPISASSRAAWDAEAGEAEGDLSVRVLREGLFCSLGQVVGCGACGFQLDQEDASVAAGVIKAPGVAQAVNRSSSARS
ncbi:hypothetical protein [Streptomyces drozdowiczii]|uniref:Uncharacterized protein n=1 Tax=Streptomyces drozdowiczii TaxID=202862 RepID=A0ABY6PKA4_9ACTN|nr:hypothetical protein [Streptomyces drozdowiczii]MCX0241898.1 hypothetical protein [Streptomyces drozdowiczii]UZK52727.1 hypothetical protein NEH16_00105 [Streptomyces drozdowiczii]